MSFGPLDLVIVHFMGMLIGCFVLPKFFPNLVETDAPTTNALERDVDQALLIANDTDNHHKTK